MSTKKIKTYTLFWLDGLRSVVKGYDIAHAFTMSGYGAGAMGALDFFIRGEDNSYTWNSEQRKWIKNVTNHS